MELIFEISRPGRSTRTFPKRCTAFNIEDGIGKKYLLNDLDLPEVAEIDLIRITPICRGVISVLIWDSIPLGSCTMKYNPKVNENVAALPGFTGLHPYVDNEFAQGNCN